MQRRASCGLVCACLLARSASAEVPRLGPSQSLLPGFFRVPVAAVASRGAVVGGGLGYGFTESQSVAPGSHHRVTGRLGAGLTPLPWLGVALGTNLRHDRHPDDELGADRGTVLDSDARLVLGGAPLEALHVGASLAGHFERGDDFARSLSHPALDAQLLLAHLPDQSPLAAGLSVGYRLDRTGQLLTRARRYRDGDRLALEVSDFDALSLGLGMSYRLRDTELLAELSGDVLLGEGAPSFGASPLRASFGARHPISETVTLRLDADVSLSSRAAFQAGDPLYPVEPRFQLAFGIACDVFDWEPAAPPDPEAGAAEPLQPALAPPSSLDVDVLTQDGHPLSDARVEISSGDESWSASHVQRQRYRLTGIRAREIVLRVSADRLTTVTQTLKLTPGESRVLEIRLQPAAPTGQLRGLIRSFDGKGLAARVRIEPLGMTLRTDERGSFQVDVPPGKYKVVVEASNHGAQTRDIEVSPDGVVILNADLRSTP
jgi:hypothetical protein